MCTRLLSLTTKSNASNQMQKHVCKNTLVQNTLISNNNKHKENKTDFKL